MYIVNPTNVDYLIEDVRLHIGDADPEKLRFSDSYIRTSIINGVKMLQRRWGSRYLVYYSSCVVTTLPDEYMYEWDYQAQENLYLAGSGESPTALYVIPSGAVLVRLFDKYALLASGYKDNDIIRNPFQVFDNSGFSVITQEDEYPIVIAASVILRRSQLSSSADSFQNWSDGEFRFSNVESSKALSALYTAELTALDDYFAKKLASPIKDI